MKTIKINFAGFWKGFDKEKNFITDVLKDRYNIEISDNPDYAFFMPLDAPFVWTKYDCVRILINGEPYSSNFNAYDYIVGFDDISFQDRYFNYPFCFWPKGERVRKGLSREEALSVLKNKEYFCNLICSHPDGIREEIFKKLGEYKRVENPGKYLNNMDGYTVSYGDEKLNFVKKCKFTICSEGLNYPGFITEKITDAFKSFSIPIYVGSSNIGKFFNEKSFIDANGKTFDEILEIVKRYDSDDELYLQTLMENPLAEENLDLKYKEKFKNFLFNILDQEPEKAFRRIREYQAKWQEGFEKEYRGFYGGFVYKVLKKLHIIKKK